MKISIASLIALALASPAHAAWDSVMDPPPTQATGIITPPATPPGIGDFTMYHRDVGDPPGEYQTDRITDYVYVIKDENTGEEYLYFKIEGGQRIIVHREKPQR